MIADSGTFSRLMDLLKRYDQIGAVREPQTELFEVINNHHIHADLMVFEKDVHKVKEGQKVIFTVQSFLGKSLWQKYMRWASLLSNTPKRYTSMRR